MINLDVLNLELLEITSVPWDKELSPIVHFVTRRVIFTYKLLQWLNVGFMWWKKEEWYWESLFACVHYHSMFCTPILVICPHLLHNNKNSFYMDQMAFIEFEYGIIKDIHIDSLIGFSRWKLMLFFHLHTIPNVDDQSICDRFHRDPLPIRSTAHLQSTYTILGQDG